MLIVENLEYLKSILKKPTIFQKPITKGKSLDILVYFLSVWIFRFLVLLISDRYFETNPVQDWFVFNKNNVCLGALDWVYDNQRKQKTKIKPILNIH